MQLWRTDGRPGCVKYTHNTHTHTHTHTHKHKTHSHTNAGTDRVRRERAGAEHGTGAGAQPRARALHVRVGEERAEAACARHRGRGTGIRAASGKEIMIGDAEQFLIGGGSTIIDRGTPQLLINKFKVCKKYRDIGEKRLQNKYLGAKRKKQKDPKKGQIEYRRGRFPACISIWWRPPARTATQYYSRC